VHNCNITGNGEYAFHAYSRDPSPVTIWASDNWWGTADSAMIEEMIHHFPDSLDQPTIQYVPFATESIDHDTASTGVADGRDGELPAEYTLAQNRPNPFNSRTQISFSLTRGQRVMLTVHNVLGQRVASLVDRYMTAGSHSASWDADDQASGVYFYYLRGERWSAGRKMILMR